MINIEKTSAPRAVIGKHLTSLIEKNNKIIVIDNDLGTSTSAYDVTKTFPKNYWELGIGEQSSLSAATGLALEGMYPVYVNFAIFATGTIWTQIRQAAYAKANLKIIATHPGLDAGPDGASHQATQDMALMRCVPNMNVLLPLDENDVKSAITYALNNKGLYYVRVSREPVPIIYNSPEEYFGSGITLYSDRDISDERYDTNSAYTQMKPADADKSKRLVKVRANWYFSGELKYTDKTTQKVTKYQEIKIDYLSQKKKILWKKHGATIYLRFTATGSGPDGLQILYSDLGLQKPSMPFTLITDVYDERTMRLGQVGENPEGSIMQPRDYRYSLQGRMEIWSNEIPEDHKGTAKIDLTIR